MRWPFISRSTHEAVIAQIEGQHLSEICSMMKHLDDVKKANAQFMSHVIEEKLKLWDELTKVRYVQTPALADVRLEEDKTPPPSPQESTYLGTPWQQVLKRYEEDQRRADRVRFTTPVTAQGETNGMESEGRVESPLGQPS